jgi:hypothetical protein
MNGGIHPDLLTALDATDILSATSYRVLGHVRDVPKAGIQSKNGASLANSCSLVAALESDLYSHLYVRPSAVGPAMVDPLAQRDLVNALSAANAGRGCWESGWVVDRDIGDGRIAVTKDGLTFCAMRDGVQPHTGPVHSGRPCRVLIGKEFRNLLPGFYMAIGDGNSRHVRVGRWPLIRLYWHLMPETAVPFMATLTEHLSGAGVPFRAKVLNAPHAYHRADAGVLYLERPWYRRSTALLARIYREIQAGLRREVPLFTRLLAAGLAMAEDPVNGMSFGQHRCHLIALASWSSFTRGEATVDARASTLAALMNAAGLNPSRPHLGPRSRDSHALRAMLANRTPVVPGENEASAAYLSTTRSIHNCVRS